MPGEEPGPWEGTLQGALYSWIEGGGGGIPEPDTGDLLGVTEVLTVQWEGGVEAQFGWRRLAFDPPVTIPQDVVAVVAALWGSENQETPGWFPVVRADELTGTSYSDSESHTYPNWPDPATFQVDADVCYCIYCETAEGYNIGHTCEGSSDGLLNIFRGTLMPPSVSLSSTVQVGEAIRTGVALLSQVGVQEAMRLGLHLKSEIAVADDIGSVLYTDSPETGHCYGRFISEEAAGGRFVCEEGEEA
ncbi:MAG: hypothetical protein ACP5KN_21230 [Armatimonadota bacterium]